MAGGMGVLVLNRAAPLPIDCHGARLARHLARLGMFQFKVLGRDDVYAP